MAIGIQTVQRPLPCVSNTRRSILETPSPGLHAATASSRNELYFVTPTQYLLKEKQLKG